MKKKKLEKKLCKLMDEAIELARKYDPSIDDLTLFVTDNKVTKRKAAMVVTEYMFINTEWKES